MTAVLTDKIHDTLQEGSEVAENFRLNFITTRKSCRKFVGMNCMFSSVPRKRFEVACSPAIYNYSNVAFLNAFGT